MKTFFLAIALVAAALAITGGNGSTNPPRDVLDLATGGNGSTNPPRDVLDLV